MQYSRHMGPREFGCAFPLVHVKIVSLATWQISLLEKVSFARQAINRNRHRVRRKYGSFLHRVAPPLVRYSMIGCDSWHENYGTIHRRYP